MPAPDSIEHTERRVSRWLDAGLGRAWVVAVSGGSDSVGLLRALHAASTKLGLSLSVAHLDHGVRGEAAEADASFVGELARSLDLPFDLGRWRPVRSGHFEADARRVRYAWLADTARERGASTVAVGHTRDDQAETVLHRVIRGTGPRGLAGMPARRPLGEGVTLVRPLLRVAREEVRRYLESIGQPSRDDAGNADLSRTRARIRHDLLPRLAADYNPQVVEALARLGGLARSANLGSQRQVVATWRKAAVWSDGGSIGLDRDVLGPCPAFLRAEVIRLSWRRAGWPEAAMDARHWRALARLARKPEGRTSVGSGVLAEVRARWLVLARPETTREAVPREPRPLDIPGEAEWAGGRVVVTESADAPRDETIDLDALAPPLWVRAPRPGDRFEPLGMGGRGTPLNDFFRGRRVAREARAETPLVCDGLGIVWVVGHRIAHRVRVNETTTRRIGLSWTLGDPESRQEEPR